MKKILYYNWIAYNTIEGIGGGIRIYHKNLVESLSQQDGYLIYNLESGRDYSPFRRDVHIKEKKSTEKIKNYSIVNSPIFSPAIEAFGDIERVLNDTSTHLAMKQFIEKHGPFDVVHFHSIEGLSANVLELKKDFPRTKFVISIHNYHWFCPQVNLWKHERQLCTDNHGGRDCLICVPKLNRKLLLLRNYLIGGLNAIGLKYNNSLLKRTCGVALSFLRHVRQLNLITKIHQFATTGGNALTPLYSSEAERAQNVQCFFASYRETMVSAVNDNIDAVLATSERVKALCATLGIKKEKIRPLYIGTKFADDQMHQSHASGNSDSLRIAYLGYMRHDKGFYFLLDTLESLPAELANKLEVVVAAKAKDKYAVDRIKELGQNKMLRSITLYDGYTHTTLKDILKGVHLGIVPVLWEDNLPQIAIELKAMGVAVLSSQLGGASELTKSDQFTFKAGSSENFIDKLSYFAEDKKRLQDYWNPEVPLKTMRQHVKELETIYFE